MGRSSPSQPRYNTNPAMQVSDISPHSIKGSGMAATGSSGHATLLSPGAGDPPGLHHHGEGVEAHFIDPRTESHFPGRDTPLTYGAAEGRRGHLNNAVTAKPTMDPGGVAAAANHAMEDGSLFGTQPDDREGFDGPAQRVIRQGDYPGGATAKSPKSK